MEKNLQYVFKIILIGDSGVGKTSLMSRFTDQCYTSATVSTIGVDFRIKTVDADGTSIKLQIWDTAGQERFKALVSQYYRGAHGIFVVFDMTDRDSFDHLDDWLAELERKDATTTAAIMILGNKIDAAESLKVGRAEVMEFMRKHAIPECNFVEVSAKDGTRVDESFVELAKLLVRKNGQVSNRNASKTRLMAGNKQRFGGCC